MNLKAATREQISSDLELSNIYENLYLRGGIDQFNLSNTDAGLKPSLGFSYSKLLGDWLIGVDYAFMMEQYSSSDRHIIGLNIIF